LRSVSEPANIHDSRNWHTYSTHPTMLGADQKAWLGTEFASHASYGLMVLVMTKPWSGEVDTEDCCKWWSYPDERREVADMIKNNGVDNLVAVSGDAHMIAYDDGSNTDFASNGGAGFPVLHSAPLQQTGSFKGGPYSHGCYAPEVTPLSWVKRILSLGYWQPDTSQFSVMEITDSGGPLVAANMLQSAGIPPER